MFNFFKKKETDKPEENKLKNALSKTISSLVGNVINSVSGDIPTEYELDDIESMLIKADLGVDLSVELVEKIREQKIKSSQLKEFLKQEFIKLLDVDVEPELKFDKDKLNFFLLNLSSNNFLSIFESLLLSKFKLLET